MPGPTDPIYSNEKKARLTNIFSFFKNPKERKPAEESKVASPMEKANSLVQPSDFISRDLSWLKFNDRVLDQA